MILCFLSYKFQKEFTEGGCLNTSHQTQVNVDLSLCFEVEAVCSGKRAVSQFLCKSCKPTEPSSCFSGNFYHTVSWSGSCCPEDCAHARHSFTYSPGPQMQASTDWHNFKAKLQPNNGEWMDGCRMLSILKRSLLLFVVL